MPTAWLTYAHDDEHHKAAVRRLADQLRSDGVDATIDAYVPHPSVGWAKWMEKQFSADYVLVVVSDRYLRDYNQEVDNSSGARFEGAVLSSLLLQRGVKFDRIGVVVFDRWRNITLPPLLHACQRYYVDQPDQYAQLCNFAAGRVLANKPALGPAANDSGSTEADGNSFVAMCEAIWPLMEDSRRLFEAFGPNSGASGGADKKVRFDLTLWHGKRPVVVANNARIGQLVRLNWKLIPAVHVPLFEKWLSHIDAFEMHVERGGVDYRDHQFPKEVISIVRQELACEKT